MNSNLCRWGILGTANIARKNWQSIRDAGNGTVVAVASRDGSRSTRFIDECSATVPMPQKPLALGSYEELIAQSDVDALYIPLPTGLRKEWVLRAANAGKHVLVEKPVGIGADDVREMIAACETNKVQFMDGVMFMHSTRLARMREVLDDGDSVGNIRRITSQFTFAGDEAFMGQNIRTSAALEPAGCLGDLGWYTIRFSLWAMNYEMPLQVAGRIHREIKRDGESAAVPLEMSGELLFRDGISASFHCSFVSQTSQWASVSGTKGLLTVADFVLPFYGDRTRFDIARPDFAVKGCQFDMREGRNEVIVDEPPNNAPGSQESNLFRTFSALVLSGTCDPHWPEITLKTQRVMDACLSSARNGGSLVAP
jgi:predicted dehydrogenase